MKRAFFIPLVVIALLAARAATAGDSARDEMKAGAQAYNAGRFEEAATAFRNAADAAPAARLDPAPAIYNEASTLFQLGSPDKAALRYADALRSPDLALQAKAYFNRGNALSKQSQDARQAGKTDEAMQHIAEALSMYENSMLLQPADEDPKVNYELAVQLQKELEQQQKQEQQKQQQQNQQQKDDKQQKDQQQQQQQQQKEQDQQKQQDKQKQQDQQKQQSDASQQQQQQGEQKPEDQQQEQQASAERPSEEMTPQEARMLLDAMRQEEQKDREQLRLTTGQPVPVDKNW